MRITDRVTMLIHMNLWSRAALHCRETSLAWKKPPKLTWLKWWWQLSVCAPFYVVCGATKWHATIMTIVSSKSHVRKVKPWQPRFQKNMLFYSLLSTEWKRVSCFAECFQKCLTTHAVPYLPPQCKITHCERALASLFLFVAKQKKGFLFSDCF